MRKLLALMVAAKAGGEDYAHMDPERFRRICYRGEFTVFAEEVARRLGLDMDWQSERAEGGVGVGTGSDSDSNRGRRKAGRRAEGVALGTYVLGHG